MHEQINAYSDDVSMLIVSSQDQDLSQSPIYTSEKCLIYTLDNNYS